jgi:hypothetical protein
VCYEGKIERAVGRTEWVSPLTCFDAAEFSGSGMEPP